MERKKLVNDLILLCVSMSALMCSAISMHISRNILGSAEHED